MTHSSFPHPETEPGIATAENGLVMLDGPDGVAATMTPGAAALTGESLIATAGAALAQIAAGDSLLNLSFKHPPRRIV